MSKNINFNEVRILVVEDYVITQKLFSMILHSIGCIVEIATNGNEALKMYQQNRYDLLVVDIGLPDMSGLELCKIIRNSENNDILIPIVISSAYSQDDYSEEFKLLMIHAFLQKPVTAERCQTIFTNLISDFEIRTKNYRCNESNNLIKEYK